MGRQLAVRADLLAVPVKLIGVVNRRNHPRQRLTRAHDIDVFAVPGKPGMPRVCLRSPRVVAAYQLPAGVATARMRSRHVIAGRKLPRAAELDRAGPRIMRPESITVRLSSR